MLAMRIQAQINANMVNLPFFLMGVCVRDHGVATRGRRRSWRLADLSSRIFLWTQSHSSAIKRPSV
jgi:uncharacterized protein (DUF1786 family)